MKQILNLRNYKPGFWIVFILLSIPTTVVNAESKTSTGLDRTWERERNEAVEICQHPTEDQLKTLKVLSVINGMKKIQLSPEFCRELYFNLSFQKVLNLSKTNINDISPLKSLKNLEWLDLSHTGITDITSLRELTNLKILHLDSVKIRTVRPLAGLTNIRELYLNGTDLPNIRPLSYLTELRVLYLNNTHIRDIRPLEKLTHLENLYLDHTNVNDITPLKNLQKLTWLGLYQTTLMDCSPKNLKELAGEKKCIIEQTPETIINELLLDIKDQMSLDNIDVEIYNNSVLRIKNDKFYFKSAQYELTTEQGTITGIFGSALQENLAWNNRIQSIKKISIEGHTDSRSFRTKSKDNQRLSLNRALAFWKTLNENINEQNCFTKMRNFSGKPLFEMIGRADSSPIVVEPETKEEIRVNRRVEFVFHPI
jgi:outer membrane protein OmpA-like peptidoglycan-associated protein